MNTHIKNLEGNFEVCTGAFEVRYRGITVLITSDHQVLDADENGGEGGLVLESWIAEFDLPGSVQNCTVQTVLCAEKLSDLCQKVWQEIENALRRK